MGSLPRVTVGAALVEGARDEQRTSVGEKVSFIVNGKEQGLSGDASWV